MKRLIGLVMVLHKDFFTTTSLSDYTWVQFYEGGGGGGGLNSSVGSVLGWLSCVMHCSRFDPLWGFLDGWMPVTKTHPACSMHHPWRWNVTSSMVRLKNGDIRKNLTQNGEPQRCSWGTQKKKKKTLREMSSLKGFAMSDRQDSHPARRTGLIT